MLEEDIIRGCLRHEQTCQHELFNLYFHKMMQLCLRYAKNAEAAKSIFINGFQNVFNKFKKYQEFSTKSNKGIESWIKNEIIQSAIQQMHDNKKEYFVGSTVSMRNRERLMNEEFSDEELIKSVTQQMILDALRELTPPYRAIYNLHELDGYSHSEISKILDISEYTSADNLSKAKFNLKKSLSKMISK